MRTTRRRREGVKIAVVLVAELIAASSPLTAANRDWYILNFKNGKCVQAAKLVPQAPTPEQFHLGLREEGITDIPHVLKDDYGNVKAVIIEFGQPSTAVYWFANADGCEDARKRAVASGNLPNMDDLK